MKLVTKLRFIVLALAIIASNFSLGQDKVQDFITGGSEPQPDGEIGIFEHLDRFVPGGIKLTKQDSTEVDVLSLIDKPTVFSFVYYNCPGLCSPFLDGLSDMIQKSDLVLGKDYQIITISMNEDDTPSLGIAKKNNYLATIKKEIDPDQWIWLTGDKANIEKISDVLGFKFKRDGDDFIHTAAIMVTSPEAKITRYLHGTYFLPFDLKMSVVEAGNGKSSPTVNKLLKYCFSYDAQGKTYVMNITKISATVILLLILIFISTVLLKKQTKTSE